MKLKYEMKKLAALALAMNVWMALSAGPARADAAPAAPVPTGDLVGTQVQVTRDTLAKLMRDLQSGSTGGVDASINADFAVKAKVFESNVSNAMTNFETALKTTILPQVALYVQNYDATFTSTGYNDSEKAALLSSIGTQLGQAMNTAAAAYFAEIRKVLDVAGPVIVEMQTYSSIWSDDTYYKITDLDGHQKIDLGSDGTSSDAQWQKAFQKVVLPTAQAGCDSVSCIELSSMMMLKFVTLVSTDLLQNITFTLADGNTVTLDLSAQHQLVSGLTIDLLSRVYIPDSVRSKLPLTCTPAQLASHQRSGD